MNTKMKLMNRVLSVVLAIALLLVYVPITALRTAAAAEEQTVGIMTDPGTAYTFESAMGAASDGNRYAGRVWGDRSVYTNGQTVLLNTRGEFNSSYKVSLEDDEAFQVIFSVLGSTMSSTQTTSSVGPIDVVLVLDTSTSMDDETDGVTRFERVINAANKLLTDLLTMQDVRIAVVTYNADSETVLPLKEYDNGVILSVNNYYYSSRQNNGVVTAKDKDGKELGKDSGFTQGTNLQSGIDRGFNILAEATDVKNRIPVAIVLTDGRANRASQEGFYDISNHTDKDGTSSVSDRNLYLSTLLNAAYGKTKIEANYGRKATVYTVGVDISDNSEAKMLMDPGNSSYGFNAQSNVSEVRYAYANFQTWAKGETVTESRWTFDHNYPKQDGAITAAKIAANINYADIAYDVSGADVDLTFDQIYEELSSGAFNPITGSTTVNGATGEADTPLIYVDFIGQHMEIKAITHVTLFGASYSVIQNADGTYTVEEAFGTNPTTKQNWNTAQHIRISIEEEADGTQKLEVQISQEILPILMKHIDSTTVNDETVSTITETRYDPLRVYYTIGLDSDILLPNGEVDISKLSGYTHIDDATGTISFYCNQFGERNPAVNGVVTMGDSHIGFRPSEANRYYYYQNNQGIFTQIIDRETGAPVQIPENNGYGIAWDEKVYDLDWMTYDQYRSMKETDTVYTYVTYYRTTADTTDAANAAEEVTYLVYTDWGYLKESAAFYDTSIGKYINYNAETGTYSADDVGYPMSEAAIAAYVQANPEADIHAVLGVGSLRTSRLHNMVVVKQNNSTGTATESFTPQYTHETASEHHGNSVVVWLGNNGKITVDIDTGIALTKRVTEAFGDANDSYALTVTIPEDVTANPVVKDASGNVVNATYENHVLTVHVKAGQTVYITGIPAETVCQIGEIIRGDYYIASKTEQVTVPTISQVAAGTQQYVEAVVTNAPNKYGSLTIVKDISHNLAVTPEAMTGKVFTFQVQLPAALAGKVYQVNKDNASAFHGTEVTVGDDGTFTVMLKDNESITILGLPENTAFTVKEITNVAGYTDTTGPVTGVIVANRSVQAHFVNAYHTTPVQIAVTVTGQKILSDLHGTYAGNENFTFVLSRYVGISESNASGYLELARQSVKAGGTYSFDLGALVQTLDLGTHYFRVTEEVGNTAGMTYDATRGLFAVVVTDENADGTLEYTVEDYANTSVQVAGNGYTVTKNFTNIYDVEMTYVDINITKILNNATGVKIPLDLFRFQLVNKNDAGAQPLTATTDASGKATIRISGLKEGTYAYTLQEVKGSMAGMQYDETVYNIVVTVTKIGDKLQAVVSLADQQGTGNSIDLAFVNTYALKPVNHTLGGRKVLNGPKTIQNGEFTFAIFQTDASFDVTNAALEQVKNTGAEFFFTEMSYSQVGTYYYVIEEVAGNQAGMTYDETHYHVTVTVGIDPEDLESLAVTNVSVNKIGVNNDTGKEIVFVNSYAVTETTHSLFGTKLLRGRAMQAREFTFELYEADKLIETVTNKADGNFQFSQITYTAAGVYTYTVKEVAGNVPGVTYVGAEKPITVVVTVEDVESQLTVTKVEYLDSSSQKVNGITFENVYTAANAQVLFRGEKTLVGGELLDGAFTFKLYKTDFSFDIRQPDAQCIDTQTNKDGAFAFDPEHFTTTGTFFYAIVEDALVNPDANVVYDSTQYNFRVTVQDDNAGKLLVKVENVTKQTVTEFQPIVDTSVGFTNAVIEEVTKKEVFVQKDPTTNIDGNEVKPGDVLTYHITYVNYTGKDVVVDILDTIPQHTTYVEGSATHNGSFAGNHLNWVIHVLKGESVTVSFSVTVNDAEGSISNVAQIRDGVNTYKTNEVVNEIPEDPIPDIPQTGDSSHLALGFALLVASGAAIAGATVLRKKETE